MSSELESDVCYRVYGWRHLVKATEVTASLAESNGSLPPGGWLKAICELTACTTELAPGPTLGNEYGINLPLPFTDFIAQPGPLKTLLSSVHITHLISSHLTSFCQD